MIRWWVGFVWAFVGAVAAAVALQAMIQKEASGAPLAESLRLSEILAGPARDWDGDGVYDSRDDEWVEVVNTGPLPVPLDDYRVADALGTVRIALSGTLDPGQAALVTGSAAVAWQRSQGLASAGLSLNNAGDTVYLFHVSGTDTTTADLHAYGSIEAGSDRSVGRASVQSEDWILYDALNRYTGSGSPSGTGCAPTPGGLNGCASAVEATTWGAIKRLYR